MDREAPAVHTNSLSSSPLPPPPPPFENICLCQGEEGEPIDLFLHTAERAASAECCLIKIVLVFYIFAMSASSFISYVNTSIRCAVALLNGQCHFGWVEHGGWKRLQTIKTGSSHPPQARPRLNHCYQRPFSFFSRFKVHINLLSLLSPLFWIPLKLPSQGGKRYTSENNALPSELFEIPHSPSDSHA